MDTESESRGRWALLIGIDHYPNFGPDWQLDGCGNDVAVMRDTLRRFDFSDDRVTVLLNGQATREGILAAMESLVQRTGKGDEVVFFYSGHGSWQFDGDEKDEADGKDETLVPCDSGRDPDPNRDISDDEIYLWLLRLTAMTPFVTMIFDCCNSGTILRDGFAGKQRSIPEDKRPPAQLAAHIPPESFELLRGGEDSPAALQRLGDSYVALLSCGSMETSNEILVGETQRIAHGALTYFLVRALTDPGFAGATWREVFERVVPQVTALFKTQHPELEGARDREVFGLREFRPMTYVPVERREEDVVILGAGKACGLTEGSRWDVYAPATRSVEDAGKYVGQLEVFEVGVTSSKAREVPDERGERDAEEVRRKVPEQVQAGMRAVESVRSIPGVRLDVEIVAPFGHAHQLAELIEGSRFLRRVSCGSPADIRVYLLTSRNGCGREDPVPMLGPISEETWAPVGRDGALIAPAFPRKHPASVECVVENLESVARVRGLAKIRNDDNPLKEQVDFLIYRLEDGRCTEPAADVDGVPYFFEGDRLVIEIRNGSQKKLFVYILDIGLTGRVCPVFPALGSHEMLKKGGIKKVGLRPGEDLQLFIPKDLQLLHRVPEGMPMEGMETLKLFVTPSRADFGPLYQPPMRVPYRTTWCLNDLLDATFHGGQGFMRTQEDWTVLERTFRLRSR